MRVGSLRKALKSRVEFVFLDAPFKASEVLNEQQISEVGGANNGRTWFQWHQHEGAVSRPSRAVNYVAWDDTYAHMADALRTHRPDLVLGFSQGATAGALLLAALAKARRAGADADVPMPHGAVLVSGFLPNDPTYAELLRAACVAVPTLFVQGAADALVPPERSAALADTFATGSVTVYEHAGAHLVPTCTGEFRQVLTSFLDRFREGGSSSVTGSCEQLEALDVSSADVGAS